MANPTKQDSVMADADGNPIIGSRAALSTAAVTAHSLTDADASLGATTQAEVEGVLNALGTAINACRTCLINHGLMKDA